MDYYLLADFAAQIGYRLAMAGAETFRVEDTIRRVLHAYGLECEVFAIPNSLTVSFEAANGKPLTILKRIGYHGNDLEALEQLNALSRRICLEKPEVETAVLWLKETVARCRVYRLSASLLGSFLVCFLLAKATLFRGLGNSYNQTGWLTAEQWRFLPFALVCDALFAVLAFWVFPVLLPLCGLHRPRRGSDARRTQLPLFLLLSLGIGVAVIAWSITVREDLGSPSPRQHTRYLEPLLIPLLAVTLDTLDEKLTKTRRRILAVLTIAWGVLFVAVCRAIGAGAGDNTLLQWFDFAADRTDRLPVLGQGAWLAVWRAVIAVGVAVLGVLLVRRKGRRVLAGAALVLCVLCYAGEWRINRWTYEIPAGTAQQASALNDALAELDGKILFIPCGVRQRDSQLIETYVARDVYIVEYETLLQNGALADGVLDLTAEAVGPEYPGKAYTDLDAADWVLAADGVPVDTSALEKADAACPAGYVLYKNLDAQCVRFLG